MLEWIVGALKDSFRFRHWVPGGRLLDTLDDERLTREHNRQWADEFLADKRLEREQQSLKRAARVSKSVNPPLELGRSGRRRTR